MKSNKYLLSALVLALSIAVTLPAMAKNGADDGGPSGKSSKSSSSKSSKSSKSSSKSSNSSSSDDGAGHQRHTGLDDAAKGKVDDGAHQQRHTGLDDAAKGKVDDGLHQQRHTGLDDGARNSLDDNGTAEVSDDNGVATGEAEVRHTEQDDAAAAEVEGAFDDNAAFDQGDNEPAEAEQADAEQDKGFIASIGSAIASFWNRLWN